MSTIRLEHDQFAAAPALADVLTDRLLTVAPAVGDSGVGGDLKSTTYVCSAAYEASIGGEGLVQIPGRGRVLSVVGGVAGDGWATGSGYVEVTYLRADARDLAVSDWEDDHGDRLYSRAD